MSYVDCVILSDRAGERILTLNDQTRIKDIIDEGATPLTEIEAALVTALNGKFAKWCPKLTTMANFAKTLDGYKAIQAGIPWQSEFDKLREHNTFRNFDEVSEYADWDQVDWANYYCSQDDQNSVNEGNAIFRNIKLDEEMERDQEKWRKAHPRGSGFTSRPYFPPLPRNAIARELTESESLDLCSQSHTLSSKRLHGIIADAHILGLKSDQTKTLREAFLSRISCELAAGGETSLGNQMLFCQHCKGDGGYPSYCPSCAGTGYRAGMLGF